jgi:hypothetical protein
MKINVQVKRVFLWHSWYLKIDNSLVFHGRTITNGGAIKELNNAIQIAYYMSEITRSVTK